MDELVPKSEPSTMDQLYDSISQSQVVASVMSLFTKRSDSNMNISLFQKLQDCNSQLGTLYKEKQAQQSLFDKAVQETQQRQAIYDTNLKLIHDKVEAMKTHMCSILDEIIKLRESMTTADPAKVVDVCGEIIHKTGELRKPLGVPVEEFFKHVDLQDMKINTDYHKAIQMNNTLLSKIEESKRAEEPFRMRLENIGNELKTLQNEVELVKNFQKEHSKLIASKQFQSERPEDSCD